MQMHAVYMIVRSPENSFVSGLERAAGHAGPNRVGYRITAECVRCGYGRLGRGRFGRPRKSLSAEVD
jgi:hypothetical protein